MADGLIRLGKIVGTHGLKGALRFRADNPDSTALASIRDVYLETDAAPRPYRIASVSPRGRGGFRIVLEGVSEIAAAEALRGATLMVAQADLPPVEPGEFYYFQVMGMEVRLADGRVLGTIEQAFFTGANDVLVVRNAESEILIPVIEDVVKSIDFKARRVTVEAIPGLLE
ncbi:MAG: ribosome maturation factor RimM [Candidatus Binataceae bacterium]